MSDRDGNRDTASLQTVTNNQIVHRIDRLETTIHNLDQVASHKLDSISQAVSSSVVDDGVGAKLDALGSQLDSLTESLAHVLANQLAFFTAIGALVPPSPEFEKNIAGIRAAADTLRQAQARDKLSSQPSPSNTSGD